MAASEGKWPSLFTDRLFSNLSSDYDPASTPTLSPQFTELVEALVENSEEAILLLGLENRILYCNRKTVATLGYQSRKQLTDRSFLDLIEADAERQQIENLLYRKPFQAAGRPALTSSFCHRDGSVRRLEIHVRPLGQGASAPRCAITLRTASADDPEGSPDCSVVDISERRKLHLQSSRIQRMEALGRMASGVAHDFNNLLTAILGYSEVVRQILPYGSPGHAELLEISRAGQKGAALTRQLLTFGKGRDSKLTNLDISAVVEDLVPFIARLLGEDIDLDLDLADKLKPIRMDRSQLEQVILNLATNAKDAMGDSGLLTLRTTSHRVNQPYVLHHDSVLPADYTMLMVRDTGCGIEAATMDHLFEPFFTTKEEGHGTGIGLSIVHGIVKQHGGFISVYNEPGSGATFKVSFPVADPVAETPEQKETLPSDRDRSSRTVLLAEDDPGVRELIRSTLEAEGYRLLVADNGLAALELAQSHDGGIMLLLSDISMPRLDGVQLANRFSSLRPKVPILLFSGTAKRHSLIKSLKVPISFVEKPFTPSKLIERIRALALRS